MNFRLTIWLAFLSCALLLLSARLQRATASIRERVVEDVDLYYLPPSIWLRVFSLGYNEVAADFVWIKTIVYFGDLALDSWQRKNNFTMNYMRTASELDPKFHAIYSRGGVLALYQKGKITQKAVENAIEIFERGLKEFPNDGEVAFHLGFIHYVEMEPFLPKDKNDPTRRFHKELGARLIRRAALMQNAPDYVGSYSATLLRREGMHDIVIEHLKALLLSETNPQIRETLAFQLRRELGQAAESDIALTEQMQLSWKKEMPYVAYDFYLMLKPFPGITIEEVLDPLHFDNALLDISEAPDSAALAPGENTSGRSTPLSAVE